MSPCFSNIRNVDTSPHTQRFWWRSWKQLPRIQWVPSQRIGWRLQVMQQKIRFWLRNQGIICLTSHQLLTWNQMFWIQMLERLFNTNGHGSKRNGSILINIELLITFALFYWQSWFTVSENNAGKPTSYAPTWRIHFSLIECWIYMTTNNWELLLQLSPAT